MSSSIENQWGEVSCLDGLVAKPCRIDSESKLPDIIDYYAINHARFESTSWEARWAPLKERFGVEWSNLRLRDIDEVLVASTFRTIAETCGPSAANYALTTLRKFFDWCIINGLIDETPCDAISLLMRYESGSPQTSR